jgi:outer membrane protein assembly factor BamB
MKLRCAALVALSAFQAEASDWPQWRGPTRSGVSRETGLLRQWPAGGPRLLWQATDIGDGYATPAVAGDRLYLLGNRGLDDEFVQALAVKDGKVLWTTRIGKVGEPDQQPSYPKARSTPTLDGSSLYVLGSDGDLARLEARDGAVRWRKSLRTDFGGRPGRWAYAESPLVDGDLVIVTPGGPDATIVALNKETGATVWKAVVPEVDVAGYASVVPTEAAGRRHYVQLLPQGLVGVDARTGELLWRHAAAPNQRAQVATPIVGGDLVYAAVPGVGGVAVRVAAVGKRVVAEKVYLARGLPSANGGAVLVGDHVYGSNPMGLVAAELATGAVKWQAPSVGPSSFAAADGHLYVRGEDGEIALVEATPDAYREKGRFRPPNPPAHANPQEKAWPHPVVANGRLYLRDLGTLWVYDITQR